MSNKSEKTTELFLEAGRMLKKRLLTVEDGVSFTQVEVLRFVQEHGHPRMRDVARYLAISAPSATALVNQLVRGGYIVREHDKDDRRQVHLHITKKALGDLRAIMNKRKKIVNSLLQSLSEQDHEDMQRVFHKMLENK